MSQEEVIKLIDEEMKMLSDQMLSSKTLFVCMSDWLLLSEAQNNLILQGVLKLNFKEKYNVKRTCADKIIFSFNDCLN